MVSHSCNPRIWELGTGSTVEGQHWIDGNFEVSLLLSLETKVKEKSK